MSHSERKEQRELAGSAAVGERAAPEKASSAEGCPVGMHGGNRCGRAIHPAPEHDKTPVCLMHSRDSAKSKAGFQKEFEVILRAAGHGVADFTGFMFPGVDYTGRNFKATCVFVRAGFMQNADFGRATFAKDANFRGAAFEDASFYGATFTEDADFGRARFTGATAFQEAEFKGNADFRSSIFIEIADFSRTNFAQQSCFNGATFSQGTVFIEAKFGGNAKFDGAKFTLSADFFRGEFARGADFASATFEGNARFHGVRFAQDANFFGATFRRRSDFIETTFVHEAHFYSAKFEQDAHYNTAKFMQDADFSGATFAFDAAFIDAHFGSNADFGKVTFEREVYFSGAKFMQSVDFLGATFREDVHFVRAGFAQDADFRAAKFAKTAKFIGATFAQNANFSGASFSQETQFDEVTFKQDAYFTWAKFMQVVSFWRARFLAGAEFRETEFRGHEKDRRERARDISPGLVFCLAEFSQPERVLFYRTYLGQALFHNCDVSRVKFSSVTWRERKNNGMGIVFEEEVELGCEAAEALKPVQGCGDERNYGLIAELYQQLKKNYDERKDYWTAGDFHFGELEMKRLSTSGRILGERHMGRARAWCHRWFSLVAWYKHASLYGESYARPLWCLAFVLLLFTFLFPAVGLEWNDAKSSAATSGTGQQGSPQVATAELNYRHLSEFVKAYPGRKWLAAPAFFGHSLMTALSVAGFQKELRYEPSYPWGRALALLELFLTSTLAALFFLAVRRQFRR